MSHSTTKPKCPRCHQRVVTDSEGQCVMCKLCSIAKRRAFRFCWDCQRVWPRSTSSNSSCTQPNCALRAALISKKRIKDPTSPVMGCPYFRACPMCNTLLTHNGDGCPNIECPKCCTEFCFRCLDQSCSLDGDEECTIVDNRQSLKKIP